MERAIENKPSNKRNPQEMVVVVNRNLQLGMVTRRSE